MKKIVLLTMVLSCMVTYKSAFGSHLENKEEKANSGSVTKGIIYLGLAAGCGYVAYKSNERANGQTDSKFTANLIYNVNSIVKNIIGKEETKRRDADNFFDILGRNMNNAQKHNNADIFWSDLTNDLSSAINPEEKRMRDTASAISVISGFSSIVFAALGLKNIINS